MRLGRDFIRLILVLIGGIANSAFAITIPAQCTTTTAKVCMGGDPSNPTGWECSTEIYNLCKVFSVYLGGIVGTGGTTPGPSPGGYRYDGYAITPTNSKLECIRTNYAPVDGSNNKKMTQKLPFYSMDAYRYKDSSGIAHMYSTPLPELPTGWSRSFGYTSNYGSFIVKRDSGVTYPKGIYAVDPDGGAGGETTVANNSLELDIDTMFHELTHQNRGPDENTAYWYGNKGLQNYQNASVNSVCN